MPNDLPDYSTIALVDEQPAPGSPFSVPRDGGPHLVAILTLPRGCQWLVIGTPTATDINAVSVTGHVTGIPYAPSPLIGTSPLIYVRVHQTIDSSVEVRITTAFLAGNASVSVSFGFAPTVTDLDTLTPSPVTVEDQFGKPLAIGPPTFFIYFDAAINAGATVALLAGVGGQVIRVFSPVLSSDVNGGVGADVIQLQDSLGNGIQDFRNVITLQPGSAGPLPVVVGRGIGLKNFSAAALMIHLTCGITQG